MSKPFRFRFVNEIAGAFVLLGVALLVVGIYVAGRAQGWFEPKFILRTTFTTEDGTFGLQEGAEVRILGALAGRVSEIVPAERGGMETTLVLKEKFSTFVHRDSLALVKKKFAIAGDAYVEITLGTDKAGYMRSGDYIPIQEDVEIIEIAKRILDDLRAQLFPLLDEIRQIVTHINGIAAQLEQGQGTIGRLIREPDLARQIEAVVSDIRRTAGELPKLAGKLDGILADAKEVTASVDTAAKRFPAVTASAEGVVKHVEQIANNLTGEVAGVQGVMLQAQDALREAQRLLEGVQRHWLLRAYMQETGESELMTPMPIPGAEGGGR
jgi:phospholipid/cholesterol/gamma-HCH transport system substrate-binding protein